MRAPTRVEVTRPDKLLRPALGMTKQAYVEYLAAVSQLALPWVPDRPLTLVRAPDGVDGERYFQRTASSYTPAWIPQVTIPAPSARGVDFLVCNDRPTLAWIGNQATLELHPAPVRRDRLDRPDLLVVDIDPPDYAFDGAVGVALVVLDVLRELRVAAGVKTTGGKGLHVVAPIERRVEQPELRRAAARLTSIVAERRPDAVTDAFRKAGRQGRVMLDPSRNGTGATIVAPYSPRARPNATLSFPIAREQLGTVKPADFTIASVPSVLDGPGPRRWARLATERSRLPFDLLRG